MTSFLIEWGFVAFWAAFVDEPHLIGERGGLALAWIDFSVTKFSTSSSLSMSLTI